MGIQPGYQVSNISSFVALLTTGTILKRTVQFFEVIDRLTTCEQERLIYSLLV